MDDRTFAITSADLYARLGTQNAPLLIDVRLAGAFDEDLARIIGAVRRAPDAIEVWAPALPVARPIVTYCVYGHEVGRGAAAALRAKGFDARHLEGGIAAWRRSCQPG